EGEWFLELKARQWRRLTFFWAARTIPFKSCREEPMQTRSACTIAMLLIAGFAGVAEIAEAQTYPTKPITIIVPFAAGGGNDIMARLLAQHMGRALGQQFVIDNRGGAAGTLGARAVAKATPDGYTLMVGHSGVFGVAPSLYGN